jgi:UDP-GlcNAc:undecaprenyl-phosphate GlcNAc-1-phosphate transferase
MDYKYLLLLIVINFLFIKFTNLISLKLKIFSKTVFQSKEITKNISLIGGLLIVINFNFIYFFGNFSNDLMYKNLFNVLIISNFFFIIGYLDDRYSFSPYLNFFIFLLVGYFLLKLFNLYLINSWKFSGLLETINIEPYSLIFTLFSIFAFMNSLNMFDGINGHSGIYVLFVMVVFYLFSSNEIFIYYILSVLFFLYFNLKKFFFIGNSGIFFLGSFISFTFIFLYNNLYIKFVEEIIFVMILPGMDMIRLFFVRIINKKNPFIGDKNHWHHIISSKFGNTLTLVCTLIVSSMPFYIYEFLNVKINYVLLIFLIVYFSLLAICKKY